MSQSPPLLRDQRTTDASHLNLLSIFHFVSAGMALLGIAFMALQFGMFHALMSDPAAWAAQKNPPPREFFALFQWLFAVLGVWFGACAILNVISAFCIRARTHRIFSVVVAAVNCLQMPLGTVLGIFTIIVLMRDTVREVYQH